MTDLATERAHVDDHNHDGDRFRAHARSHDDAGENHATKTLTIQRSLLDRNDQVAKHNREHFQRAGLVALNVMSSPGAGKTRLLERTLADLAGQLSMAVIVGDLETDNDARRLRRLGTPVLSVTTGTMCHLEAGMVHRACHQLDLASLDVLFIENVGNLVCPASFDLGEAVRVVLMSVAEGEDKPLKYPPMFKSADVVLLTKTDMADAAGLDRPLAIENIRRVAPQAKVLELSARTGEGLAEWYEFLKEKVCPVDGQSEGLPAGVTQA